VEKGVFVKEIEGGRQVSGVFLVQDKQIRKTRDGRDYLVLLLKDRSGEIGARVWDNASEVSDSFSVNDYVAVEGVAEVFREEVQINIKALEPLPLSEIDLSLFMPVTREDRGKLWNEFQQLARKVKSGPVAALLQEVCRPGNQIATGIMNAPAAKKMHHAYIGGLLEHSVSVARLACSVCKLYPRLDKELLLAGALLHDIGKIEELDYSTPNFEYTDRGRLMGHIGLGIEMLDRMWRDLGLLPEHEDFIHLKHLILSHHGQREMGSPVLPMTEEAVVLHFLDDMDAKLNYLAGLGSTLEGSGRNWTGYQPLFGRYFFLNAMGQEYGTSDPGQGDPNGETGPAMDQQTLWKGLR